MKVAFETFASLAFTFQTKFDYAQVIDQNKKRFRRKPFGRKQSIKTFERSNFELI